MYQIIFLFNLVIYENVIMAENDDEIEILSFKHFIYKFSVKSTLTTKDGSIKHYFESQ